MTDPRQHMETSPRAAYSLLEEVAQTRQALKQLKAQLRESEARYRALFESLDEGFCVIEKVEGEAGAPPDFRFIEANPAFAIQTGMSGVVGKTMRQLFPGEAEERIRTYDAVCRTGEPIRFERDFVTLGRVLELYAFRVADQTHCRVAINFHDITGRKEAEETLRGSEKRFRAMVTASSDSMCRMSPDWSEMRQIYDTNLVVEMAVPNGNWLQSYVYRDDQPRLMALIQEAIRTKSLFEMEHRVRLADGSWGWMLSRAIPLLDARGEIVEWFGVGTDVTEQKRAAQALRESDLRYRNLFNAIDEGFCVIEMLFDEHKKPIDYRFLEVNPAFERQTGMHNAAGKRMRELVPDIEANWIEIYGQVALTGEPIRFVNEAKAMDGRWFDVNALRIGGPESSRVALLFSDITERRQAEQALDRLNATLELRVQARTAELSQANAYLQLEIAAKERLRESEERLLTVAENLAEGLVITSMEGEFIHWNHAALNMHGFTSMAECLGQLADFTQLIEIKTLAGATLPFDQWPMSRALHGELVHNSELRVRRTDTGVERILSYGGSLVRDSAGKPSAFLTVTDITERKRAEEELRELNDTLERRVLERTQALAELDRRKDEFLAMLGHELRNPLAALSNAVQLLRLQKHEEPLLQQGRAIIERQLGHLKHLVDDLLEVSRINSGIVRLRQDTVNLSGIVEGALETAQPLILQHRHQLTLSLPPEPIFLQADAARLEQVLLNLLTNAAKYTDDGGRIWLSAEQDGNEAVLKVRDNGIGIAPELLPRIFDLFTQAKRSLDRSQGGLGIGLCLVQRLVEMRGGSVEAHSVLGQGSEFVVRLPILPLLLTALPASPAPASPSAPPPQKTSSGCRVLVVDDNVDAAQSLTKLLEMTGHEARLAYDGPSALQAAIDYRPEVVLLDIGLPGLDGYEVAERIRQQDALKGVVLVALTGYGQDTDRQRSQEAGFDHHLVKPSDFDEIEKILANAAEKRSHVHPQYKTDPVATLQKA